tara:strand:- start:71 stop:1279 length:1209 start_codon:yes stop_codon:yes gene_type:complete
MNKLERQVAESTYWKKDANYCAKRIGISVEKYIKIKKQIKNKNKPSKHKSVSKVEVNVDKGEAKFEGTSSTEPKDANEIIKLLKIDTNKWKLSQYWNKQMSDHWRISALVTKLKETESDHLEELLKTWKPRDVYRIPHLSKPERYSLSPDRDQVCGVMSLQDIHFGKEGNETVDKDFEDTIINLIKRGTAAHNIEELFFVVGGDLINMDTFHGTTTSGTLVDSCMTATDTYIQAFDAMIWAITFMLTYVKHLTIVYIPGNHDRLSSFHLVHALSKAIDSNKITWDIKYEERKVHVWHNNFNAFEHGDKRSKNNALIYATEYPKEWGSTTYRTLFKGHIHTDRKVEYMTSNETAGFIEKTLPSLGKTDYYHYSNKYVGNRRSGKLELQSPNKGNIDVLTYTAD